MARPRLPGPRLAPGVAPPARIGAPGAARRVPEASARGGRSQGLVARTAERLVHNAGGVFGLAVLGTLVACALLAPVISPYDPLEIGADLPLAPPSREHLFGTDDLGRDVLSRVLFGAQISLTVAFLSGLAALCLGVPLGLAAGYRGGKVDAAISRVLDTIFAFPSILLGIALVAVLGSSILNVVLAVAVINVPTIGRLVRVAVLAQRSEEYVEAARVLGASGLRVVGRHILPNVVPPLLVQATIMMGDAILLEAAFSFLGLGSRPPAPSWGAMLDNGRTFLSQAPWLGLFPGIAITLAILGLNSLGDALRVALNPRRR